MIHCKLTEHRVYQRDGTDNCDRQAVGILTSIAVYTFPLHESSQEFLLRSLSEASSRLQGLFQKFVDDQIRAIEDTKVKINKRKGVIAFMRVFPHFSIAVENIFVTSTRSSPPNPALMEVRHMIDAAYERILQAMWVSLKQIAREGPSMGTAGAAHGGDSEDKEVLNYHILLVENMNHIVEETDDGGIVDSVLTKWKAKAMLERQEHLEEYVKRVVRRPLGKLLVSDIQRHVNSASSRTHHDLRISWSPQRRCSHIHQPQTYHQSPPTPVVQRKRPSRPTTAEKFAKASKRYESVSRSISVKPTTKRCRRNSLDSCAASAKENTDVYMNDCRRSSAMYTLARRRRLRSNGARRTLVLDSGGREKAV